MSNNYENAAHTGKIIVSATSALGGIAAGLKGIFALVGSTLTAGHSLAGLGAGVGVLASGGVLVGAMFGLLILNFLSDLCKDQDTKDGLREGATPLGQGIGYIAAAGLVGFGWFGGGLPQALALIL